LLVAVAKPRLLAWHEFLRSDMVIEVAGSDIATRWIMIDVMGVERGVRDSAREAMQNLLAYRQAFDLTLAGQDGVYGIGIRLRTT
jgi:hypothetical protein